MSIIIILFQSLFIMGSFQISNQAASDNNILSYHQINSYEAGLFSILNTNNGSSHITKLTKQEKEKRLKNCNMGAKGTLLFLLSICTGMIIIFGNIVSFKFEKLSVVFLLVIYTGIFLYYNLIANECRLKYDIDPINIGNILSLKNILLYLSGSFFIYTWSCLNLKQKRGWEKLKPWEKIALLSSMILFFLILIISTFFL